MPARPEPSANVSALIRATSMPQASAIFGFRMIARTWVPNGVRYMISQEAAVSTAVTTDDEGAIAVDLRAPQHERSLQHGGNADILQPGPQSRDMDAEERQAQFKPHGLLDQDRDTQVARRVSSRRPYRRRTMTRSMARPDQRGHDEGQRNGREDFAPSQMPVSTVT